MTKFGPQAGLKIFLVRGVTYIEKRHTFGAEGAVLENFDNFSKKLADEIKVTLHIKRNMHA